jgi:mono/diheme cytochrome c family protein
MNASTRFLSLACGGITLSVAFMAALLLTGRAIADPDAPSSIPNADGQQVYQHICRGCHMPDGAGAVGAGHYPALAKDLTLISRQYMALTILAGRRNMPAFGAKHALGFGGPPTVLSDAQIAAVINYVRSHFGNHYKDTITAAEVDALDQSLHPQ